MNCVEPYALHEGASLVTFATTQRADYDALPASVDQDGTVMTEWEPTPEERARLAAGGRVRVWLLYTGVQRGQSLTPIKLEAVTPATPAKES